MNTKLTLSLNKDIIIQAKEYAKKHNVSLSFIIENYLLKIVSEFSPEKESLEGSIVNELSGIINLNTERDYKEELGDYLKEKYK